MDFVSSFVLEWQDVEGLTFSSIYAFQFPCNVASSRCLLLMKQFTSSKKKRIYFKHYVVAPNFFNNLPTFSNKGCLLYSWSCPKILSDINRKRKITNPFKWKNHVTDKEHFFHFLTERLKSFSESTRASLNYDRLFKGNKLSLLIIMEHMCYRWKDDLPMDFCWV